jgi:hypothetical protein
MQANDAMRILGSAAAMGLLGGGSALAYNAISQPTLDEYGHTIESNDINPFVAALGSAAVGAAGGYGYGKYNQPVAKPVQGMSVGVSPQREYTNVSQPRVIVTPANPMEMQNPMSPPGMKTVVVQQPPKAPGQEMMEESLRLRELAEQQRLQNLQPVYQPRSDDEEMASMQWLRRNRANYQAQKKMM